MARRAAASALLTLLLALGLAGPIPAAHASERVAAAGPPTSATMCVDPDWEPYEQITGNGDYVGIAADLVRLVAERAGIELELVPTRDWDQSTEFSKAGRCDILAFLNQTVERDAWLIFTEPYFVDPNVFITRTEHDYISDPAALSGVTIALPGGTSIEERIRRDYPGLTVLPARSETQALQMVEDREADLTLRSLTMAAYTIRKEGWFNLKISGEIPSYANRLRIGVRRELPALRDALNSGVASLTPREVREAVNRHVPITMASRVDYGLVAKVVAGALTLLGLGLCWVFLLRRLNSELTRVRDRLHAELAAKELAESALRESEERYRLLVETAQEGIVVTQDDQLVYTNPMTTTMTGHSPDELARIPFLDLVAPEDRDMVLANHRRRLAGETAEQRYHFRARHRDGSQIWVEVSGTAITWNGRPATLNFITDITERRRIEEQVRHMAQHDPLTNLPNRALFADRLRQALVQASRYQRRLAVMFIDLDDFKPVNDTLGHDAGDDLLRAVARRLRGLVRESDTVARLGGDEFVLLLPVIDSMASAENLARKIHDALARPFATGGHDIRISSSIGVAVHPDHGATERELCKNADAAMYRVKGEGKGGVRMFSPQP